MFGWLFKPSHKKVKAKYRQAGADFGDAISYIYMGECIGFVEMSQEWAKWERQYAALGYRTISLDRFTEYGGYGKPLDDVWEVKREDAEPPIFHAVLFARMREETGKAGRHPAVTAALNGESASGTYNLPSTETKNGI
jgi:hypothetical protein